MEVKRMTSILSMYILISDTSTKIACSSPNRDSQRFLQQTTGPDRHLGPPSSHGLPDSNLSNFNTDGFKAVDKPVSPFISMTYHDSLSGFRPPVSRIQPWSSGLRPSLSGLSPMCPGFNQLVHSQSGRRGRLDTESSVRPCPCAAPRGSGGDGSPSVRDPTVCAAMLSASAVQLSTDSLQLGRHGVTGGKTGGWNLDSY